jgi:hypothetical protein
VAAPAAPFAVTGGVAVVVAGTAGSRGGDAFTVAAAAVPSGHAFFLRGATPPGGFSVTSARHFERAAKTPW